MSSKRSIPSSPQVHPEHGSNVLLDKTFVWGEVDQHFAESPRQLSFRVTWGRNSTVPIETFGVLASWDPWHEMLDVWASIQMPKYAEQIARALRLPANAVRVHYDVDVGGSYGVKRGIKHTVLVCHLARKLGRPVRLIEDRLDNMRSGDAHGPERIFDVSVAFDDAGIVKSMKMRALDNVGAYAGRAPFQLGKPIGAIVGPYRIESVQYQALSVMTNKAAQEAVRGFGQAPTNYAIETAIDKVAAATGLDRIEVRRRNFIRKEEFPYLIPSGTRYDSGDYHTVVDKVLAHVDWPALERERDRLRGSGMLAGIGIAACLEPSGGNSSFEPLLNPKNTTTTWMDSCRIIVDGLGHITRDHSHDLVRARPRDAGRDRGRRGAGDRSGSHSRGAAGLAREPAEQFAGRQPHGGDARRRGVPCGAEAQAQAALRSRRTGSASRPRTRSSTAGRRDHRPRERQAPRMDRPRHHRAPQHPPDAGGPGTRAGSRPM